MNARHCVRRVTCGVAFLLALVAVTMHALPAQATTMLAGIDVSKWQGTINWSQVAADPKAIKFVIIKATEGQTIVDPNYSTNKSGAKGVGIVTGAYHFARPDTGTNDAGLEADNFVNHANIVAGDLIPALDLEVNGGLSVSQLISWTQSWLNEVVRLTGVKPMIYSNPSFWSNSMGNTTQFADEGFNVLWIAHWTNNAQPTVPANNWGGHGWTFWQWTDCWKVQGISSQCVDGDRYNGTDLTPVTVHVRVTSASPSTLVQGSTNQTITVSGVGFQGGATPTFSGSGVTVNAVTSVTATSLSASVSLADATPPGARYVTVTNPDGSSGACLCLTVLASARFHAMPPTRIYGTNAPVLTSGSDRQVTIAGIGGIPSTATAVALNVEIASPSAAGYLRMTPSGTAVSVANQEFAAGQTISNHAVVAVGTGGQATLHLSAGQANVFVDAQGWYSDLSDATGDRYTALAPARVYGAGAPAVTSSSDRTVTVAGLGGVPTSGVDAVVLNVEVADPTSAGYVRVTPSGLTSQTAVQEFEARASRSNLVVVPLGAGGAVNVHLSAGSAQIFVDVQGYYSTSGTFLHPVTGRLYGPGSVPLRSGSDVTIPIAGRAFVPASGVTAVLVNVELYVPTSAGYLRVVPAGTASSTAVQEFASGQTISTLVAAELGTGGAITLHLSAGTAQAIVDIQGYWTD